MHTIWTLASNTSEYKTSSAARDRKLARLPAWPSIGSPCPLRLPRLVGRHAARVFALVGFDLCAMVVHAVSPLLGPERYLTLFYPDTWRDIRCLRRLFLELRPDIVISFLAATNVKTIFAARQIRQPVLICLSETIRPVRRYLNRGALVHNSRSRSIIALHPEIRGPA